MCLCSLRRAVTSWYYLQEYSSKYSSVYNWNFQDLFQCFYLNYRYAIMSTFRWSVLFFSTSKTSHFSSHFRPVEIASVISGWTENGLRFLSVFKSESINLYRFLFGFHTVSNRGWLRAKRGQREGKERVRIGKPHWTLSLPPLYPLWKLWIQWMNGIEIQNECRLNESQKKHQNQVWNEFKGWTLIMAT